MAIVVVFAVFSIALSFAVWLGSLAYTGWRHADREQLRQQPIARQLFGAYESPFPWHRSDERRKRDAA